MKRIALLCVLAACGPSTTTKRTVHGGGHKASGEEPSPIKPDALKAFDSALRAMKLGGPESLDTARERFQKAAKLDPSLWEAWYDLGTIDLEDGQYDDAAGDFSHSLEIDPSHTPSRIGRGEAYARAKKNDDARHDFEQCLTELADDDPRRAPVAARLAGILRDMKKYDDAVDVLRDVLRVQGASAPIYTQLGLLYLSEDRLDMAEHVLALAIGEDKNDPGAHNALALLYQKQGKAQDAFDQFDAATSLDPDYVEARFNKASVLLDAGDYARAKTELAIVVEKSPDDWNAQVAYGLALRGLKDFKEAKSTWGDVIKDAPRRSSARADAMYDMLILDAYFLEDMDAAKKDLERYMQDAPSSHPKRQEAEQKRKELGL